MHSWPSHEKKKKECNHGSKPRGGLNYAWLNKAQGYQRAMSQQTQPQCGAPDSRRTLDWPTKKRERKRRRKEKKETEKQTGDMRSPLLINHWVCVMTSAATLKLNFSQAFKTLLKAKHSHSGEVKRQNMWFTLPVNHLKRRVGRRSHQQTRVHGSENDLLPTKCGHDFTDKTSSNSQETVPTEHPENPTCRGKSSGFLGPVQILPFSLPRHLKGRF